MKFFGSLFILGLISLCTVSAKPYTNKDGNDINQKDDTFRYWISDTDKKATITGVIDPSQTKVVVKAYLTVKGERYYVNQIGSGAFSNTEVQTIVVNDDVEQLNFSYNSFFNAKRMRTIELYNEKVTADVDAFADCGPNLGFKGRGTASLANDLAKKLLTRWNIKINKDFTNVSNDVIIDALYNLAKNVKNNFTYSTSIAYPDNAAVVLGLRTGGTNGIARAFRILALNMGFQYNDVHVGGDNKYYSWNLVHVNTGRGKKWYNLDVTHTDFDDNQKKRIFRDNNTQIGYLKRYYGVYENSKFNSDEWIIYINQYNFQGEQSYGSNTENFTNWLVRNRKGVRA